MHEPLAILGAMTTGRPVRYGFDRAEEMQVGAPRGAEVWHLTDAVGADGRILGRRFRGYFDAGAYTRLSSYAVQKGVGHVPGPYTIPNVSADVYCVFTNRTPATAMRGFGITGVDWAIERHMDRVARAVGMDPLEFRLLNAYRDGDMTAHRRVAKNCALIECAQVAAEKAGWPLSAEASALSSLTGGGGPRGELPARTATDQHGRIGERRRGATPRGGTSAGSGPCRAEERVPPTGLAPRPPTRPAAPQRRRPARPAEPPRPEPRPAPERSTAPHRKPEPSRQPSVRGGAEPPRPEPRPEPPSSKPGSDRPYQHDEPFTRGVWRPGGPPRGTRRR